MQGLYTFQIPTHKLRCRCFFNSSHEYKNNQFQHRYIPYPYLDKFFKSIYLFLVYQIYKDICVLNTHIAKIS